MNCESSKTPLQEGQKVNAAANVGLFMGVLFIVFNIVILIFSLTGVGGKIVDVSVFELYLLLPYWIISLVGVISCIKLSDSRFKAVFGMLLCIANTIICVVMFKSFLMPDFLSNISRFFNIDYRLGPGN